jgi:cytochrome oxidase Cu insertion factor (SCO1/SenC/PrrC family)
MLLLILAICAAPVVASYLVFYVFPPSGRTNHGELITPQPPPPGLSLTAAGGEPYSLASLRGRWVLLHVDQGACDSGCAEKLFMIRQLRTMTGKERTRIDRAWMITDAAAIDPRLLEAYAGTVMVRADRAQLSGWLQVPDGRPVEDFIFLVDPLGNLMMRYGRDADPVKIRKDLGRLLKASRVG